MNMEKPQAKVSIVSAGNIFCEDPDCSDMGTHAFFLIEYIHLAAPLPVCFECLPIALENILQEDTWDWDRGVAAA